MCTDISKHVHFAVIVATLTDEGKLKARCPTLVVFPRVLLSPERTVLMTAQDILHARDHHWRVVMGPLELWKDNGRICSACSPWSFWGSNEHVMFLTTNVLQVDSYLHETTVYIGKKMSTVKNTKPIWKEGQAEYKPRVAKVLGRSEWGRAGQEVVKEAENSEKTKVYREVRDFLFCDVLPVTVLWGEVLGESGSSKAQGCQAAPGTPGPILFPPPWWHPTQIPFLSNLFSATQVL